MSGLFESGELGYICCENDGIKLLIVIESNVKEQFIPGDILHFFKKYYRKGVRHTNENKNVNL